MPAKWRAAVQHKIDNPFQPLLAFDKVRFVGEPIAVIVAESRYVAEDAAELAIVDPGASCTERVAKRALDAAIRRLDIEGEEADVTLLQAGGQ